MIKKLQKIQHLIKVHEVIQPQLQRKKLLSLYYDLMVWVMRNHGNILPFFQMGLHKRGNHINDYITYREFKKYYKDFYPPGYLCILEDKLVFEKFINNFQPHAPRNLGFITKNFVSMHDQTVEPLENIKKYNFECIVKDTKGWGGNHIFKLSIHSGDIFINGNLSDIESLKEKIYSRSVIQELLIQHEKINKIYPSAINTLRIITVNTGTDIHLIAAFLRMGSGGLFVDNMARGNMAVPIKKETGKLSKFAISDSIPYLLTSHPDTKTVFEGYEIPYYFDSTNLCKRLHGHLPYFFLLGWDVATTTTGPVIVECNNIHHAAYSQFIEGGQKKKFDQLISEFMEIRKKEPW